MPPQLLPPVYKMLGHAVIAITSLGGLLAIDFTSSVTLGSIIVTVVILAVAGIFTIRSKIADIWREEAEGERAAKERLQEELATEKASRAEFEKEQQEIRHDLKNQIAGCKAQLQVMEAKTDLTMALEEIRKMQQETIQSISNSIADIFIERSKHEHDQTHRLLEEIRDKLPTEPVKMQAADVLPVHEVDRGKGGQSA